MSINTYTFHSLPPAELGTVTVDNFDKLAAINSEIGTEYMTTGSTLVSPDSVDYKVEPDNKVSVITRIDYGYDGAWGSDEYTLQDTTTEQGRLLCEALEPFIAAGRGWLHSDETIIVSFFRSLRQTSFAGEWHLDSASAKENFRALLFYDSLPTQFAVGSVALDTLGMEHPLTPRIMNRLLSNRKIEEALDVKDTELTVIEGPTPLQAVGITHEHLHRAAPVPRSMDGVIRTFLRLATIRP